MAKKTYRKSILSVGTHSSPDGSVEVTSERLQHWADEFDRMSTAQQVIPMHWDHGDDRESLLPISAKELKSNKSRSAKNTKGKLVGVELAKDGQSAEVIFDVTDSDAIDQFDADTVFVSPVIMPSWKDGAGGSYEDVITHLDIVNYPVDHAQSEAEPVAMGLRMGLDTAVYRLALHADDKNRRPFDDENTDHEDDNTNQEDEPSNDFESSESNESEVSNSSEPPPEEENEGGVTIGNVLEQMRQVGIPLPDDTTAQNFLDRLNVALGVMISQMDSPMEDTKSEETTVVDPQIARMSLHFEKQNQATIKKQLEVLRNSGRCTPAEFEKYSKAIETIKLSLNKTGDSIPSRVETFIEDRSGLPAGTCWDASEKIKAAQRLSVVGHPDAVTFGEGQEGPTNEEAEAHAKRLVPLPGD